jgi:hypothetical protein
MTDRLRAVFVCRIATRFVSLSPPNKCKEFTLTREDWRLCHRVAALQMMMLGAHSEEVAVSSRNAIRRPVELGPEGEKMTEQGTLIYIDSRN